MDRKYQSVLRMHNKDTHGFHTTFVSVMCVSLSEALVQKIESHCSRARMYYRRSPT